MTSARTRNRECVHHGAAILVLLRSTCLILCNQEECNSKRWWFSSSKGVHSIDLMVKEYALRMPIQATIIICYSKTATRVAWNRMVAIRPWP